MLLTYVLCHKSQVCPSLSRTMGTLTLRSR